jgi:hypothetical protein
MLFPLLRFWTYTPWGWLAAVVWNISELLHIPLPGPVAPFLFGLIMGQPGERIK